MWKIFNAKAQRPVPDGPAIRDTAVLSEHRMMRHGYQSSGRVFKMRSVAVLSHSNPLLPNRPRPISSVLPFESCCAWGRAHSGGLGG